MQQQPLIVFDSGIGGLSILRAIMESEIRSPILYLADQANFPYGNKDESWIESRLIQVANWARSREPLAVIIACNTATVNGIEKFRTLLDCPVVGVEPIIKPLAQFDHPLLFSTSATLDADRTQDLLTTHIPSISTLCPSGLVQAIEDMDQETVKKIIHTLAPVIKEHHIDSIGLSCTHYPLVKDLFRNQYPDLTLLDPAKAVVKRLLSLFPSHKTFASLEFLTTGNPQTLQNQVKYYLNIGVQTNKVSL